MKKILVLACAALLLASCGMSDGADSNGKGSDSPSSSSVVSDAFSFVEKAITLPEDTTAKVIFESSSKPTFVSSDSSVAELSSDGTLIAKSVGTTSITGTVGKASDVLSVTVTSEADSSTTSILLSKSSCVLSLDGEVTYQISAKVIKDGVEVQNPAISFSSADSLLATVSSSGLVTALKEGETDIEVSYGKLTASFKTDIYTKAIKTTDDWLSMIAVNNVHGDRYYLANDLDFSGISYVGYIDIGTKADSDRGFGGEVNGFGHSLSNITMGTNISYNQSLFGSICGATIRNIAFENVVFTQSESAARLNGLAGYSYVYEYDVGGSKLAKFNEISNVYMELVFPSVDVEKTGLFGNGYAYNIDNLFLVMKNSDGSDLNPEKCALLNAFQYYWWGNSNIASSVLYCPNSIGYISGNGELDSLKYGTLQTNNAYIASSEMDAIYGAANYLDSDVWDIHMTSFPTLKTSD